MGIIDFHIWPPSTDCMPPPWIVMQQDDCYAHYSVDMLSRAILTAIPLTTESMHYCIFYSQLHCAFFCRGHSPSPCSCHFPLQYILVQPLWSFIGLSEVRPLIHNVSSFFMFQGKEIRCPQSGEKCGSLHRNGPG